MEQLVIDLMGDSAYIEKWMFRASRRTNSHQLENALIDMAFQKRFFRVKLGDELLNSRNPSSSLIQVKGFCLLDMALDSAEIMNIGHVCLINRGTTLYLNMASNLNVALETRKLSSSLTILIDKQISILKEESGTFLC